jgi:branched-chain amino acid transport system ATP-binding protein
LIVLIDSFKADGLTIMWIEHVLYALLKVSDRLVCMAEGDLREVMQDPAMRSAFRLSPPFRAVFVC